MLIISESDKAELKKALGVDVLEEKVKALEDASSAADSTPSSDTISGT